MRLDLRIDRDHVVAVVAGVLALLLLAVPPAAAGEYAGGAGYDDVAADGAGGVPERPDRPSETLRVPEDYDTIQAAVDAARPNDLILVAPGVYREAVEVTTSHLTIRGEDRGGVIIDGEFTRPNGVEVVGADGVVIENMTARNHQATGFYWTGVRGYRGSYLTAYNNENYGIYAYASVYGQFDHSYASGSPDSGFYIGECKPCHAVITDVLAENNALGFSGTNASGDLTLMHSTWRHNMAGVVPNTLDSEDLAPQDGLRIVGNLIYSNHNDDAPTKPLQYPSYGNGVIITGGNENLVEGNLIWDHPAFGVVVVPNVDDNVWLAAGNRIRHNTVWDSRRADLSLGAPAASDNCFTGNRVGSTLPGGLQRLYGCGGLLASVGGGDPRGTIPLLMRFRQALGGDVPSGEVSEQPVPPPQPSMPDIAEEPRPAYPTPESDSVPAAPIRAPDEVPSEAEAAGFSELPPPLAERPLTAGLFGMLLYLLVPVLYIASIIGVIWSTAVRRDVRWYATVLWSLATVLLPIVGGLVYLVTYQVGRRAAAPGAAA